jgi:hypothetical protein
LQAFSGWNSLLIYYLKAGRAGNACYSCLDLRFHGLCLRRRRASPILPLGLFSVTMWKLDCKCRRGFGPCSNQEALRRVNQRAPWEFCGVIDKFAKTSVSVSLHFCWRWCWDYVGATFVADRFQVVAHRREAITQPPPTSQTVSEELEPASTVSLPCMCDLQVSTGQCSRRREWLPCVRHSISTRYDRKDKPNIVNIFLVRGYSRPV